MKDDEYPSYMIEEADYQKQKELERDMESERKIKKFIFMFFPFMLGICIGLILATIFNKFSN